MASKDYINEETATVWVDSGGDKVIPLSALAADAVAMGAYLDLGAAPRADRFSLEVLINGFATATVVGEEVRVFFSQSIATTGFDGAPTTDPTASVAGTITKEQMYNCLPVDVLSQYDTTAGSILKITGIVTLTSRYISPIIHNATADAFLTSTTTHKLTLTPIPREAQ